MPDFNKIDKNFLLWYITVKVFVFLIEVYYFIGFLVPLGSTFHHFLFFIFCHIGDALFCTIL